MFEPLMRYLPKRSGETLRRAADVIAKVIPEYVGKSFIAGGAVRDMAVGISPPSKDVDWFIPFAVDFIDDGEYRDVEHKGFSTSYNKAERLSEEFSSAGLYSSVNMAYGQRDDAELIILPKGKMKSVPKSNFDENIFLLMKISDRPISERAFTIDLIFSVHESPEEVVSSFDVNINACWMGVDDVQPRSIYPGYPNLSNLDVIGEGLTESRYLRMKHLFKTFFVPLRNNEEV